MQKPSKRPLLTALIGLSGLVIAHTSGATDPAAVGLVPPGAAPADDRRDATPVPGLWPREQQLGLKPLTRAARRTAIAGRQSAGLTFYAETRMEHLAGHGAMRSVSGMRYPLAGGWSSVVEATVQPSHDAPVRAYSLTGRLDRVLSGGRGLSIGLQYSIQESDARGILPTAFALAHLTGQGLRHPYAAAQSAGYELRFSYRYGERNSVGLAYGSAREFDIARAWPGNYPMEGRQYSLSGRHWLTSEWSLSYGVMANEQGGPRGQGLRLGFGYSF